MSGTAIEAWLGAGQKYSDAPPAIRREANDILSIPTHLRQQLLHDGTLRGLASCTLLEVQAKNTIDGDIIKEFFSRSPPASFTSTSLLSLRYQQIPSPKVINSLFDTLRQAWTDGYQSVRYAHLAPIDSGKATVSAYPLFVVSYWKEILDEKNARGKWQRASDFVMGHLHSEKNPELEAVAAQTWTYMNQLPWNQPIRALQDNNPIHTLYRLLGKTWLSSSQINNQLRLLNEESLDRGGIHVSFRYEGCDFVNKVVSAYKQRSAGGEEPVWLCSVGNAIARGKTLLTVPNLENINDDHHWVGLVVNGLTYEVSYGDPFGDAVPGDLKDAINWLLSKHLLRTVEWKDLPITRQDDFHNCGPIALDAVRNYGAALPSLSKGSAPALALARMKLFNKIAERILRWVRTDETAISDILTWFTLE